MEVRMTFGPEEGETFRKSGNKAEYLVTVLNSIVHILPFYTYLRIVKASTSLILQAGSDQRQLNATFYSSSCPPSSSSSMGGISPPAPLYSLLVIG